MKRGLQVEAYHYRAPGGPIAIFVGVIETWRIGETTDNLSPRVS
jgi:hypothetical protein